MRQGDKIRSDDAEARHAPRMRQGVRIRSDDAEATSSQVGASQIMDPHATSTTT